MSFHLTITPLEPTEIDAVISIEQVSFTDPFSRDMFESELSQEAARIFVAKKGDKIVGYIDFWVVLDEVHLINLAVHPDYRRRGIAKALFLFMLNFVPKARFVYLEVRPSNNSAKMFYEKMGFWVIGKRKEYYRDKEDAMVMVWKRR